MAEQEMESDAGSGAGRPAGHRCHRGPDWMGPGTRRLRGKGSTKLKPEDWVEGWRGRRGLRLGQRAEARESLAHDVGRLDVTLRQLGPKSGGELGGKTEAWRRLVATEFIQAGSDKSLSHPSRGQRGERQNNSLVT